MRRTGLRAALAGLCLAGVGAQPGAASNLVLICYLQQSGQGIAPRFIRRIELDAAEVILADDTGQGFRALPSRGRLVSMSASTIVFDYASSTTSGRSTIDRRSGAYGFSDGRFVLRGRCTAEGADVPF